MAYLKIAKNPPTGKRRANANSRNNPKNIKPQQRITEYFKESFTVASNKFFARHVGKNCHLKEQY